MKYRVKIEKKEINNNEIKSLIKNVKKEENTISYDANYIEEGNIFEKNNKIIFNFIRKHLISLLLLIFLMIFILNLNFCFLKLDIKDNNLSIEEKEQLKNDLKEYYDSILIFKYLNTDINIINNEIKSKYYQYEWINIYKEGIKLNVEIKAKDNFNVKEDEYVVGDLYASCDGIIYKSYVQKGVLLVFENYFVKEGDLLVSGNLKYNNIIDDDIEYIKASGIILALVFEVKDIKIKKVESELKRSGRIEIFEFYKFSNKEINCSFENYETEVIENNSFFSKTKIVCYELIENYTIYNYDDALMKAKNNIYATFDDIKIHEDEKVVEIILLNKSEDNEYYYFSFLMKAYKNIAEFKEYKKE